MITVSALLVVVAAILLILHLLNPPRVPLSVVVGAVILALLVFVGGGLIRP
jgi:hypothetical protein